MATAAEQQYYTTGGMPTTGGFTNYAGPPPMAQNVHYTQASTTTTTTGASYQPTGGYVTERGQWIQGYKGYMHPLIVTIINFFLPGAGHLLIKQNGKALSLFVGFYLSLIIVIAFCFIIIGFFAIPFLIALWVLIMADGWQMASKLRHGFPIMKGECTNSFIKFFAGMFKEGPVFVSGKPDTWPAEYRAKVGPHAATVSYP